MASSLTDSNSILARFSNLDLKSAFAIVSSARKGINAKVFYDFANSIKMPEKNLASLLNISSRTIGNYKERQKNLEPLQSEHLLKLIALFGKGEEIFSNVDEFNYWFKNLFGTQAKNPLTGWLRPEGLTS